MPRCTQPVSSKARIQTQASGQMSCLQPLGCVRGWVAGAVRSRAIRREMGRHPHTGSPAWAWLGQESTQMPWTTSGAVLCPLQPMGLSPLHHLPLRCLLVSPGTERPGSLRQFADLARGLRTLSAVFLRLQSSEMTMTSGCGGAGEMGMGQE